MIGHIFDCYVDGSKIVLWIKIDDETVRVFDDLEFSVYVGGDFELLNSLRKKLEFYGFQCCFMMKQKLTGEWIRALEVRIKDLEKVNDVVLGIEQETKYKAEIFNADIPVAQLYLYEKNLFPMCKVEFEMSDDGKLVFINNIDDNGYDYELPRLKIYYISVETSYDVRKDFECEIKRLQFSSDNPAEVFSGSEAEILEGFIGAYDKADADVVLTEGGDSYLVDYLRHRMEKHGLEFNFGREIDVIKKSFSAADGSNVGRAFFSYGKVIWRNPFHYFRGRWHIDVSNFMFEEAGLEGIVELARTTKMLVQRIARLSPGSGISNLQVYTAYKRGFLIPYKKNHVEDFKSASSLIVADKGGLIYEPSIGIFENVAEIDFSSAYPSIMVNNNLSLETVNCWCCRNEVVPEVKYSICTKRRGLIPEMLEPVIKRRLYFKRMARKFGEESVWQKRNVALRWILHCCFGYTGYKNAKFGKIEVHEAITAFGRHKILMASRIAEEFGFEVLHGIVDSLWIRKKDGNIKRGEVLRLCEAIKQETGINIEIEGIYKWIVFLPSVQDKRNAVPARFYGLFKNGKFKIRGLECRRRDTPGIVKNMQREFFNSLRKANDAEQFRWMIPELFWILKRHIWRLRLKKVELDDLVIRKSVSKTAYGRKIAQGVVLEQLKREGICINPGGEVDFVIRDFKRKDFAAREIMEGASKFNYDFSKYSEMLVKALESMIGFFGFTKERIFELLKEDRQLKLYDFSFEWITDEEKMELQRKILVYV